MTELKVVEIKKDTTEKKTKSFDKKGHIKHKPKKKETPPYSQLLQNDSVFLIACELAGLPNKQHESLGLSRQYGKWRNKRGLAYKFKKEAMKHERTNSEGM